MRTILLCILLMVCYITVAQDKPEITKEQRYVGKALYGFMNGGSDLYYEYGFEQLTAQEMVYMGEEFSIERYKMVDPVGAFGIYSVHAFRCLRADTLDNFNCQSQYQLQAVDGDEYISIVFHSGSEKGKRAADELMHIFTSSKASSEKIAIPQELSSMPKPYSEALKLLGGPLAINNIYSDFAPWVDGMEDYSIWLAEMEGYVLFVLKDVSDMNTFKSRIPASNIIKTDNNSVMVRL